MEIREFGAEEKVPAELLEQMLALQDQAFPGDPRPPGAPRHDPALRPRSMLVVDDGRVLAALDVLSKEIAHVGRRYAASGLSAVVVSPQDRGAGHGIALVRAARSAIAAGGADLGIFTCDRPLLRFYSRAGWELLDGAVLIGGTNAAPLPSDRLGKIVMASFFTPETQRHAAEFAGSRIELFPGEIDRLW